jgi:ribonuclease P protein component
MISDGTFPKSDRLIKTKDFRKVYKEGSSVRRDGMVLISLANGASADRLGIVVSSRTVRLAIRRNRIKRLLREVYRRSKESLRKGFDLIVIIKKEPARSLGYMDMRTLFLELARRAGLLS